jgi:2-iminobutanoate/2-iminopropanoate deaminase
MKRIKSVVMLVVVVVAFAATAQPGQQKDQRNATTSQSAAVEYSSATNATARPFSDVVRVGSMLFLSGKLGTDSTGKLAPGGIAAETKQALENIRTVLEKNGSSMDNVVKCTVMLADMKEWAEMNTVYVPAFKKERMPARSAFGTTGLAANARVEIECIATVK